MYVCVLCVFKSMYADVSVYVYAYQCRCIWICAYAYMHTVDKTVLVVSVLRGT